MKKLLFMGVSNDTKYALDYCKKTGIYSIVTDYSPKNSCVEKELADEVWEIDVKDLEKLAEKCRLENVSGVYGGNSEFCLDYTKELAKKLDLPFYASDDGWRCARDKGYFKEKCIEVSLTVPKRYHYDDFADNSNVKINYPIIIKPSDGSASRGLSICRDKESFNDCYTKALQYSKTKDIIIEDFIDGDEFEVTYYIVNGKAKLTGVYDMLKMKVNERNNFALIYSKSKFYNFYVKEIDSRVQKLLKNLNCNNGMVFIQMIYKDNNAYLLEFGYRLDGIGWWTVTKPTNNFSAIEKLIDFSIGNDLNDDWDKDMDFSQDHMVNAIYFCWANPGLIKKIEGLELIKEVKNIDILFERFIVGDTIEKSDDMIQIAYYIGVWANTENELIEKIKYINKNLYICDSNDNNLFIPYEDYKRLER